MAKVVAFVPDLLFGSNVVGAMRAAGHECALVSQPGVDEAAAADVLVIDLTADAPERLEQARGAIDSGVKTLAFYSHVEADVRALAEGAGVDLVVPRSRMAREGAGLVDRLLTPK